MRPLLLLLAVAVAPLTPANAQVEFVQTQTDDYTRYELLAPETQSFRILYDVSATTPGARYYFNGLRTGSEHTVDAVYDLHSGHELPWRVVDGAEARSMGMRNARDGQDYLAVTLARPVPAGGQARVRIDKTYRDTASYWRDEAGAVHFDRLLGIDRNAVVLPAGYELVAANYPVQVAKEADGRIRASFMNRGPAAVPLEIVGRRLRTGGAATGGRARSESVPERATTTIAVPATARADYRFSERAFENRDITYFLQQPETHSFKLFHDYTESRPGVDRYLNVVRSGSKASDPAAVALDTGEPLRVETLRGGAIAGRGIDIGEPVTDSSEVIVIWFDPVGEGASLRLRITETYTDPGRYLLQNGELLWDRSFGRARNTVVLPEGWYLTANAVPAVITESDDGRIRLRYINDRPGTIEVFIRGERR